MSENTIEQDRIEQDLEQTRARMDDRLSELEKRLSPGQILDDLLAYFRGQEGANFGRNLMQSVQNNPLPSALTGIGLTWLMASNPHPQPVSGRSGARPAVRGTAELTPLRGKWQSQEELDKAMRAAEDGVVRLDGETESGYRIRVDRAKAELLGVNRQTEDTDETFGKRVEDALSAAKRSVTEASEDLGERVKHATQQLSEKVGTELAEGKEAAQKLAGDMVATITGSPVLLGALGLAAGALLGALVPQSEAEEASLSGIADQARETASDLAEGVLDQGGRLAEKVLDAGRESAHGLGLTADKTIGDLADAALSGELVGDVKKVAQDSLQAGEAAVRGKDDK